MIKKYIKFFLFACLCFIIADIFVNADERDNFIIPSGAQFYDNNNGFLTSITTDFINNAGDKFYMSDSIHTIPNSSGAAIGFNLNEPLIAGYVYTISVSVGPIGCGETRLSSVNRIGIGGSYDTSKANYQNGGNATIKFSDYQVAGQGYKGISYAFVPNTNGTYIVLPYTTANNCTDVNYFYGYTISNLGSADNVSNEDINNSLNNQTNIITNNIQSSEQNIINNQNENNESLMQNATCPIGPHVFDKINYTYISGKFLDSNGEQISDPTYAISKYIAIKPNTEYTLKLSGGLNAPSYCFYTSRSLSSKISCSNYAGRTSITFTTPSNASFMLISFSGSLTATLSGPVCNDWNMESQQDVNNSINDVNDTLNDDDTTGATDSAGGFFNDFTTDTHGLTAIITAPLSLISSITSSSCSPLVLPLPYVDKDLTLPCMGAIYSNYFGSFLSVYQLITFGIVAYWVCVRIFNLVKDFKNPDHDEIEVLDL